MSEPSSKPVNPKTVRYSAAFKLAFIEDIEQRVKHGGEKFRDAIKSQGISDASFYTWRKARKQLMKQAARDAEAAAQGQEAAPTTDDAAAPVMDQASASPEHTNGSTTSFPLEYIPERHPPPARLATRKLGRPPSKGLERMTPATNTNTGMGQAFFSMLTSMRMDPGSRVSFDLPNGVEMTFAKPIRKG